MVFAHCFYASLTKVMYKMLTTVVTCWVCRQVVRDIDHRIKGQERRTGNPGQRTQDREPRTEDTGQRTEERGPRTQNRGSRSKDSTVD